MKNTFKIISLFLLFSLSNQVLPNSLVIEKAQKQKTEKTTKNQFAKNKRLKLKQEKEIAKQKKQLKNKLEKTTKKRSLGKKIGISIGAIAGAAVTAGILAIGYFLYIFTNPVTSARMIF